MSVDVAEALRDGFRRLVAPPGLVWLGVFVAFGAVNAVVQQSLNRAQFERFFDGEALGPLFADLPITSAEFIDLVEQSTPLAYLESSSIATLLGLVVVFAFVAEAIRILAIRTFVRETADGLGDVIGTRRLGMAVLNGFVAGVIVSVLVIVGTVLFVVPGVFLALSFLFVRQEVAVADENVVDAIEGSWHRSSGHRVSLLVLVLALLGLWFGSSIVAGLLVGGDSAGATLLGVSVDSAVLAYSVAVVTRAYHQLEGEAEANDDEFEDIDPELLP